MSMRTFILGSLVALTLGASLMVYGMASADPVPGDTSGEVVVYDPTTDVEAWSEDAYRAVKTSNWALLGALLVAMGVAVARKFGAKRYPWMQSWAAMAVLAFLGGVTTTVIAGLTGGASLSASMLLTGARLGVMAAAPMLWAATPPKATQPAQTPPA